MTRRSDASAQPAPPPTVPDIPPADVLGRLAALQTLPTAELKAQWRELFGTEPPPLHRRYPQSRLAYPLPEVPSRGGPSPARGRGGGPGGGAARAGARPPH